MPTYQVKMRSELPSISSAGIERCQYFTCGWKISFRKMYLSQTRLGCKSVRKYGRKNIYISIDGKASIHMQAFKAWLILICQSLVLSGPKCVPARSEHINKQTNKHNFTSTLALTSHKNNTCHMFVLQAYHYTSLVSVTVAPHLLNQLNAKDTDVTSLPKCQ